MFRWRKRDRQGIGHLGGVRGRSVFGWAYVPGQRRPAQVECYLDDRLLGRADCSLPRPDVRDAEGLRDARLGFSLTLPADVDLAPGQQLRANFAGTSVPLRNSPYSLVATGIGESIEYLFLHIPKTAGTSFRTELERYFGGAAVFPGRFYLPDYAGSYPVPAALREDLALCSARLRVLTGHYPLPMLQQLAPAARSMVFLREPVARAVSYLRHARAVGRDTRGRSYEAIAGLGEERPNPQLVSLQTRLLSSRPNAGAGASLESALENLAKLDFVGITEAWEESLRLCNALFGFDLEGTRRDNPGSLKEEPIPEAVMALIERLNADDRALYEAARERFRDDARRHSIAG